MKVILSAVVLAGVALGQQTAWGKCGGIGWDGPFTCVTGYCCTFSNDWYSQCLPGSCSGPSSSSITTTTTRSSTTASTTTRTTTTLTTTRTTSTSLTTTRSSSSSITTTKSSTTASTTATTTSTSAGAVSTFTNPIIYQDIPDNDVFLGPDGYYYLSASNFHFSPGAPILRSSDLQNWESIGHSIPTLDFGDNYSLIGSQAYRRGTWASSMRYRKSNKTWYWVGCIDFWNSFIYTAASPSGPWVRSASLWARCFYDCGLFIDDDDKMFIVHGSDKVNITTLTPDGLAIASTQQVLTSPTTTDACEGNRMYKRNGLYYILNDVPGTQSTWIWKSPSPLGPWVSKLLQAEKPGPVAGGGTPHQGSLIQTPLGDWYFISFTWAYPLGRIPVIAPITWGADDYPILGLVNDKWNTTYPNALPSVPTPPETGTDSFVGTTLSPRWEWNHNPDVSKYVVNNGVTLSTATVTNDLYLARNTLAHRFVGGTPVATVVLDTTNMADGDRTGLAAFRDWTAYIGVVRSGSTYSVVMQQGMTLSTNDWSTTSLGTTVATATVPKGKIWLRGTADARAAGTKLVSFQYSLDGVSYISLGGSYTMNSGWELFIGYRWGIFNYATVALGGSVKLLEFNQV